MCFEAKKRFKIGQNVKGTIKDCLFNSFNEGKSNNPIKHSKQHNNIKKYGEI